MKGPTKFFKLRLMIYRPEEMRATMKYTKSAERQRELMPALKLARPSLKSRPRQLIRECRPSDIRASQFLKPVVLVGRFYRQMIRSVFNGSLRCRRFPVMLP